MSVFFKAATCEKCGAPLSLYSQICPSCGVPYVINWAALIPDIPLTKGWDLQLLNALLWQLGKYTEQYKINVRLALASKSEIDIFVMDRYGSWERRGDISYSLNTSHSGPKYSLSAPGSSGYPCHMSIWWQEQLGEGERIYSLEDYSSAMISEKTYLGESEMIQKFFINMWIRSLLADAFPAPQPRARIPVVLKPKSLFSRLTLGFFD